jgi:excinuclease ABC subunit B
MQRAIEETNRRRKKQLDYNTAHGITPRGIEKRVTDIMEGARSEAPGPGARRRGEKPPRAAAELRPEALVKEIKRLEAEMFRKARNLEFEEAATLRDEIDRLKQLELGLPAPAGARAAQSA